ncbi:hypothetical protein ACFZBC_08990 [Streptomyces luteogriseus]|uniref:hypothetical protein n=1 Tax=Streptomyces luteogriseus TaxID=68233 RepID=UPI0036E2DBD7
MGFLNRREQSSSRDYPAAGVTVTGSASRFLRSKTRGAREAGAAAEAWEQQDRNRDRKGDSRHTW